MDYKYDVALSFSDEKKREVGKIANYLEAAGLQVFFYKNRQQELISHDLDKKTYEIYHEQSLVKVLFLTERYGERIYTQLEKRLSIDSTKMQRERLIIVNYLGNKIEAEFGKVIYIDGNNEKTDEIAMRIQQRVLDIKGAGMRRKPNCENKYTVVNNKGIVAGDNASFRNITFN